VDHLRRAHGIFGGTEISAGRSRTREEADTGQGVPATDGSAAGDPHLAGRALAQLAWCRHHLGRPDLAHRALREAEPLLEPAREPRLALAVGHGLVWSAMVAGWHDVARELLPTSAGLAEEIGADRERRSLRRAAARLELAAGHDQVAERELREIVREASERALGIEALDAAMDLALVIGDRPAALSRLADKLLPLVVATDLHKAGVTALMAFRAACQAGSLDADGCGPSPCSSTASGQPRSAGGAVGAWTSRPSPWRSCWIAPLPSLGRKNLNDRCRRPGAARGCCKARSRLRIGTRRS
jgi:hypothetical protein